MSAHLLLVDDEPIQLGLLEAMARRSGYQVRGVASGAEALSILTAPGHGVDLVILDLVMPDLDGFAVLERLQAAGVDVPVIVQTSANAADTALSATRLGATDFIVKPVRPERFQISAQNALRAASLAAEIRRMTRRGPVTLVLDDLPARSEAMAAAVRLGRRAAASTIPVLLEGERGTGKRLFARAIAASGHRASRPFVAVDCAALSSETACDVLFGLDANGRARGKVGEAHGGTLFLGNVGDLDAEAQEKLLRLIEDGRLESADGRKSPRLDVRLIAASSENLIDLVKIGRFREDLYFRLGVFPIGLPSLRARIGDIGPLARSFLARFAAEESRPVRAISATAMALLTGHAWPGNVRQLEKAVLRAATLADRHELTTADFPDLATPETAINGPVAMAAEAPQQVQSAPGRLRLTGADGHVRSLEEIERDVIANALSRYNGQMTEVARRLQIGRSTLYRKLKDLDLEDGFCGLGDTQNPEAAA
ncbi:sigma-54-dependent transcriptional regulator [Terrihabitans sp. B22-R8]|uniref:sigma-54-dependent transcriptional regulator n=1 Tax=Terrihabitans sp. B22-R8 TaxID=3425128 RepID=UPI00403C5ED1